VLYINSSRMKHYTYVGTPIQSHDKVPQVEKKNYRKGIIILLLLLLLLLFYFCNAPEKTLFLGWWPIS
jgi:hypothetical protein